MDKTTAKNLTLHNLQDLDKGKVALAVNQALRQCAVDIQERPGDKTRRKVVLVVDMGPILDKATSVLDTVEIGFTIKVQMPVQKSRLYPMLPTKDGLLVFQPGSPMDPRQEAFSYTQEANPPPPAPEGAGATPPDEESDTNQL